MYSNEIKSSSREKMIRRIQSILSGQDFVSESVSEDDEEFFNLSDDVKFTSESLSDSEERGRSSRRFSGRSDDRLSDDEIEIIPGTNVRHIVKKNVVPYKLGTGILERLKNIESSMA
jgi:hypothetical protein